jgi:hypothetical protein
MLYELNEMAILLADFLYAHRNSFDANLMLATENGEEPIA